MARRKRTGEEHENHDRWLVSYADFITLLFAFFTTMYALSSVNEGKYRVMSESMAKAFNPSSYSSQRIDIGPNFMKKDGAEDPMASVFRRAFSADYKRVQALLSGLEKGNKASINIEKRGIVVSLSERVIFESGKADLLPGARVVVDEIALALKDMPNQIKIEGHTDNIPIDTPQFPSNWELSSARALTILKYLVDSHGLNPGKLSAAGYGEFRPIVSNDSPEQRGRNRRVDIVIINNEWAFQEPS